MSDPASFSEITRKSFRNAYIVKAVISAAGIVAAAVASYSLPNQTEGLMIFLAGLYIGVLSLLLLIWQLCDDREIGATEYEALSKRAHELLTKGDTHLQNNIRSLMSARGRISVYEHSKILEAERLWERTCNLNKAKASMITAAQAEVISGRQAR